jgi:hypothetical protein
MRGTETQSQYVGLAVLVLALCTLGPALRAQQSPYFVVYDHHMEEPGELEISFNPLLATPKEGRRSVASNLELEYGANGWWTTALYLDGTTAASGPTVFTGYHLENRFRILMNEHAVNPVFYFEYADGNGADRIAKEVVGFDSWRDFAEPISEVRHEKKRELETKLILSGDARGWNVAGNVIAEKNLAGDPWELGYALGTSRPLAFAAQPRECRLCPENFALGLEMYGGLGEQGHLTLADTSHYLAASLAWSLPNGITLRVSPARGLTSSSNRSFMRFGIEWEGRIR